MINESLLITIMTKHNKMGTYHHFCVLIFAQGTWREQDSQSLRDSIQEKRKLKRNNPYSLYDKLTFRDSIPTYSDCQICQPIYELFEELKGQNDGILYQGHHYLIPEDDMEDMKELVNLVITNSKVKKLYVLYLDPFRELKRTVIRKMRLQELKEKIIQKKNSKQDFINILDERNFKGRILYEISKY